MSSFINLQNRLLQLSDAFDLRSSLVKHHSKKYSIRKPSQVKSLIIHHSASRNMDCYQIADYHVKDKGWPGIGYHICIDRNGFLFLCNSLSVQSYHAKNHNFKSISICLLDNLEERVMTNLMSKRLCDVIQLFGYHFHPIVLYGHKEVVATKCPGESVNLNSLRQHYANCLYDLN